MSAGAAASGASGAAIAAAISNVIKACGSLIKIEPKAFESLVAIIEDPLVVSAEAGFFTKHFKYLVSYRGLVFHTKSNERLNFDKNVLELPAKKISIPDI